MKKSVVVVAIGLFLFAMSGMANAEVIYSSMPNPYPDNLPSLGYEATSTQEFGNRIEFAGTSRTLSSVTVALSDWAKESDWGAAYPSGYYQQSFTLNLYNTGTGINPGTLITSLTTTANVPLRPDTWTANGILFNVTFDFAGLGVTLPDQIVYGLAFNTTDHGYNPTGVSGPYDSLNFGLNTVDPSIGTDVNPGDVFWNTSYAGFYADKGVAGVSTFRQDTDWSPYVPAIEFDALNPTPTPEPSSALLLLGFGFIWLVTIRIKKTQAA
ncbi:MAG: hypothetical protein ACP5SH_09235 [Syntrophobacteraceae bacterium]